MAQQIVPGLDSQWPFMHHHLLVAPSLAHHWLTCVLALSDDDRAYASSSALRGAACVSPPLQSLPILWRQGGGGLFIGAPPSDREHVLAVGAMPCETLCQQCLRRRYRLGAISGEQ